MLLHTRQPYQQPYAAQEARSLAPAPGQKDNLAEGPAVTMMANEAGKGNKDRVGFTSSSSSFNNSNSVDTAEEPSAAPMEDARRLSVGASLSNKYQDVHTPTVDTQNVEASPTDIDDDGADKG